jgi:pyruvate dehydrogenase E2 component (dihydrolipoamide acetyltransferase)
MVNAVLPELGEGIQEATVSYWHFEEGDTVEEGEDLVELATEKATFNIPAPASGVISQIFFEEGEVVKVGEVLATIEEKEDEIMDEGK